MVAAMEGRWHMVELLLEHGADVNAHTPDRLHTALSYSMICRDQSLVDLLLGDGAEIDHHAKKLADKFGVLLSRDAPEQLVQQVRASLNPQPSSYNIPCCWL